GNIRPFRIIHFVAMFFIGLWAGTSGRTELFAEMNFFDLIFAIMAIFFAWEFSVVTNDIMDSDIDSISNAKRPLPRQDLSHSNMLWLAGFYLLYAILCSTLINPRFAYMIMSFIAIYWLYSMPPARLKRIPVLSIAMISFASIILIFDGIVIAGRQPIALPNKLLWAIFVVFSLAFNAKDLKDYEGDKQTGIKTLMTILGKKNGTLLIAVLIWVSYCIFPMILGIWNIWLLIVSFIFGGLSFFLTMKNYGEKAIFIAYFIYFATLSLFFKDIINANIFT
ncbi:hypothetical protein DRQ33_05970, partial [bacterium]